MTPRLLKISAAASMIFLTLTGCGFGSSVDSLLEPPMLSDEQTKIYTALKSSVGGDVALVYPRSGDYRSAIVFYDLDNDGMDEAAVFYENPTDSESTVRVNIIDRSGETWRSVYDHAGAGSTVEQVFFTDLGGTGKMRMAIGYGYMTPTEKTLKIYSLDDGILNTEYTETYYKTIGIDLDNNGGEDIAVINCNNENHPAYISLVSDNGNGAECITSTPLNENTIDLPSVIGGYIANQTPALFVDGLLSTGSLSTEIIYCINGQLRNPANLTGSEIPIRTTRSQGLYSRDIDGDGIIEMPEREAFPGYRDGTDIEYITNWNVFENYTVVKKHSSLTDADKGYAFMLPVRWEGLVTVKTDALTGESVFYKFNTNLSESRLELMRILVCDTQAAVQKALEGYVTIASSDSTVYMVKFGDIEDNLLLTVAEVSNNFYIY